MQGALDGQFLARQLHPKAPGQWLVAGHDQTITALALGFDHRAVGALEQSDRIFPDLIDGNADAGGWPDQDGIDA
jgi:hypothetical protein